MTSALWTFLRGFGKPLCAVLLLAGCSVNPATGQQQFAALMSPAQETRVGADEHQKVIKSYGVLRADDPLQVYVNKVGRRVAADTERPDVSYKFFVLDSPVVNAFALPGGYVYVTRGLLAQAGSEAELAAVLAHEVGHITARHSAERYSRGVLTTLGAAVVAAAVDSPQAAQAASLGSELYIKSYSRAQEHQADELGVRYLHRADYDLGAMGRFLENLGAHSDLEARIDGRPGDGFSYFSTHPRTADRIGHAYDIAAAHPPNEAQPGREEYLASLDGMIYGDSERQGLVRGNSFYHRDMDFTFSAPPGFRLHNESAQVTALSKDGTVIVFDAVANQDRKDPVSYIAQSWLRGQAPAAPDSIDVNGKRAATVSFPGVVGGRPVTIRLVAVSWTPDRMFRFQMAIPQNAGAAMLEELKRTTYSLRPLTAQEKRDVRPWKLAVVTARAGDTAESLAARMPFDVFRTERFRVLNGLRPDEQVVAGRSYKLVSG